MLLYVKNFINILTKRYNKTYAETHTHLAVAVDDIESARTSLDW